LPVVVGGLGRARLGGLNLGYSANGVGHGAVGNGGLRVRRAGCKPPTGRSPV
jgi:hypothetical protein